MKSKNILIISIGAFIIAIILGFILIKPNNVIEVENYIPEEINDVKQTSTEENVINNVAENEVLENVISDTDVKDNEIKENNIKQEEKIQQDQVVVKQEINVKKQEENKQQVVATNNTETIKKEEIKIETTKEEVKETEPPKKQLETETKTEVTNNENKQQERVVTTKINNTYIQKMKNYLETHESSMMKTYGYEIVVDSSIMDMTNGFTFSDLNMSAYTKTSAGTIRIYAEDYYVNGEFGQTLCYVL